MPLRQKYLEILSGIVPTGAVGIALLLGAAAPSAAKEEPLGSQPSASGSAVVSERLAAIREAVSAVAGPEGEDQTLRLAWGNWWHNYGWRPWPGWLAQLGQLAQLEQLAQLVA